MYARWLSVASWRDRHAQTKLSPRCRYIQTAAYAGHEQDPKQQRLAADKARRQVYWMLTRNTLSWLVFGLTANGYIGCLFDQKSEGSCITRHYVHSYVSADKWPHPSVILCVTYHLTAQDIPKQLSSFSDIIHLIVTALQIGALHLTFTSA